MRSCHSPHRLAGANRRLAAMTIALACLATLGCARPLSLGLADRETDRLVEAAAADDSFPSAAEVGLADDGQSDDETPEVARSHDAKR
jgi:hypothetical protein